MSFASNELNLLILRYLQETGLSHTAYVLSKEADTHLVETPPRGIPAGALLKILQKGMYFAEAELVSLVPGATEAGQVLEERLFIWDAAYEKEDLRHKLRASAAAQAAAAQAAAQGCGGSTATITLSSNSPSQLDGHILPESQRFRDRLAREKHGVDRHNGLPPQRRERGGIKEENGRESTNGYSARRPMQTPIFTDCHSGPQENVEIDRDRVRTLKRHAHEVFICSWSPREDILASGSGDSTARIWNLKGTENPGPSNASFEETAIVLKHHIGSLNEIGKPNNKDVTSLDWNSSGQFLATGCYDGFARVWDQNGNLHATLGAHKGPIFALKWNMRGDLVLSAGVDKSTIVWDPVKNQQKQQFIFHSSSALDVDWVNEDTFASCSTDKTIQLCKLGNDRPLRTYTGHTHEVNAIKYDQHSNRLASCSDDMSIKIWSLTEDEPVYELFSHDREIYTIRWSPIGNTLASASFDHSVRLWDVTQGKCTRALCKHTDPVYSVGFSPDGRILASGSFDRSVLLWDVNSGALVGTYTGTKSDGGIFEVAFNRTGEKLSACASDGSVIIMDLRYLKNKLSDPSTVPIMRVNNRMGL